MRKDNGGLIARAIVAVIVSGIIGFLFAAAFFVGGGALGHDWYPIECCSGEDCRPVACADIIETETGLRYDGVDFAKQVERPSRDSRCHVCIRNGIGLCVFTLQGS